MTRAHLPTVRPAPVVRELRDMVRGARSDEVSYAAALDGFERNLARTVGVRYAVVCPSGRAALAAILSALDLEPGASVIMPAWTDASVPKTVMALALTPLPCDVRLEDGNLDPEALAQCECQRPAVVIPTHILGNPCDMDRISAWASARGVAVVEDCAHALGARWGERPVGSFGVASFLSFAPFKPVEMAGGGAVLCDDQALAARVRATSTRISEPFGRAAIKLATRTLLRLATSPRVYDLVGHQLFDASFSAGSRLSLYKSTIRPFLKRGADRAELRVPHEAFVHAAAESIASYPARLLRRQQLFAHLSAQLPSDLLLAPLPGGQGAHQYAMVRVPDRVSALATMRSRGVGATVPSSWLFAPGEADASRARELDRTALMLPWFDGLDRGDIDLLAAGVRQAVR